MKSWFDSLFRRANTPSLSNGQRAQYFTQVLLPAMETDMEWRNLFGEFEESTYDRFKKEGGKQLPCDYEAYLRAFNGGIPNRVSHPFGFLFSMQTNEMEASLLNTLHWPQPPGKRNWLVIGRDGAMGLYFLSLNGEDYGSIHSCFAWSDAVTGEMSYQAESRQVAESFGEMFNLKSPNKS